MQTCAKSWLIFCGPRGRASSLRQISMRRQTTVQRHHLVYKAPIVIDARTKPGFPDELIVRPDVADLVESALAMNISPKGF